MNDSLYNNKILFAYYIMWGTAVFSNQIWIATFFLRDHITYCNTKLKFY